MSEYTTAASALRCKECLRTGELTAAYVCEYCFGPLEVLYDMDEVASRVSRERIAAVHRDDPGNPNARYLANTLLGAGTASPPDQAPSSARQGLADHPASEQGRQFRQ